MIDREILIAFFDEVLDSETRARVEAELAHEPEALTFLADERNFNVDWGGRKSQWHCAYVSGRAVHLSLNFPDRHC